MKFISFLQNKIAKFGILNNQAITDLTGKISGSKTLKDAMNDALSEFILAAENTDYDLISS